MSDPDAAKKKKQLIIAAALGVVFVVMLLNSFHTINKKKAPKPAPAGSTTAAADSLPDRLVFVTNMRLNDKLREDQEKVWEKEWERDPFAPPSASALVRAVNLTLKGVLWDEAKPRAIVNEKTLLVGDTIYGYTVVDIKPRSVTLKTGEKSIELRVFRPIMPETPSKTG